MINPYESIDLQNMERVLSVSHQHLSHSSQTRAQSNYDEIYRTGVRHFAISRYRPSIQTYPFDYEDNTFTYVGNPFDSTLPIEELKEEYAFTINCGNDAIGSTNTEHVYPLLYYNGAWNKWSNAHINGIGSRYESGLTPQAGGYNNVGLLVPYSEGYKNILLGLQYPDGGGIIINHANWTENNKHVAFDVERFISDSLDFDERVLGTDIIEGGKQVGTPFDETLIDNILKTGRRCWIFAQGDWGLTRGRNELMIPAGLSRVEKERACLLAYRSGAFFARYANSELSITSISYGNDTFEMTADNADGIKVVIDGVPTWSEGDSVSVEVPASATYIRAMAYIDRDDDPNWDYEDTDVYKDVVYTNPIMINEKRYKYNPAYDILPEVKKPRRLWLYG